MSNTLTEIDKIDTSGKTIYPDYKYCVWLIPEGRYWYDFNRSIIPHMSVKTHLELSDALNLHKSIVSDLNHRFIEARVSDNFVITNDNGFIALEYNLYYSENNHNSQPLWWPNGAHMSMLYKYNKGVTQYEKQFMNTNCLKKHALFGTPCIFRCKGHYSEWQVVKL